MSKELEAVDIIAEHHAEHGEAGSQQMPGCWCGWQGEVLEHPPWHPIPGIADALHAAHVVSVLAASGHTIVPAADVKSVRMVAEYALHLRVNGERAPGGDETWAKFDRFAEAVLRATGRTAAEEDAVVAERKEAQPVRDQLDLNPNNLALLGSTIPDAAFDGIRALAKRWLMKRLEEGVAGSYAIALEHCADELDAAIDMAAAAEEDTNDCHCWMRETCRRPSCSECDPPPLPMRRTPMTDTLTKIARLHDLGYGYLTVNGVWMQGAKARLYCVHCEVEYPCQTMALFPKDAAPAAEEDTND